MPIKDPEKRKQAAREASKRHYDKSPDYYRERNARSKERKAAYIRSQREQPCNDCGIQHPWYVMEFDHIEPKFKAIASMTAHSWKQIYSELAKCELVCANCHAIRTWQRNNEGL